MPAPALKWLLQIALSAIGVGRDRVEQRREKNGVLRLAQELHIAHLDDAAGNIIKVRDAQTDNPQGYEVYRAHLGLLRRPHLAGPVAAVLEIGDPVYRHVADENALTRLARELREPAPASGDDDPLPRKPAA